MESGNEDGGIKSTSLVAISIAVIIVVCIVLGVAVFLFTRHRYEGMLKDKISKAKKNQKHTVNVYGDDSEKLIDHVSSYEYKLEDLKESSKDYSSSSIDNEDIPEFPH